MGYNKLKCICRIFLDVIILVWINYKIWFLINVVFFYKKYRDCGYLVCMCIRIFICFILFLFLCIDWFGIIDYVMKFC